MEPWYSDVKCAEIRAITSGISKFVRMRNSDLSGKCGCGPDVIAWICPKNPDVRCGEIRAITTEISEKIRMRNGEKSGFACLLLLAVACLLLNKVLEHFQICDDGFLRMFDAEKSGQSSP